MAAATIETDDPVTGSCAAGGVSVGVTLGAALGAAVGEVLGDAEAVGVGLGVLVGEADGLELGVRHGCPPPSSLTLSPTMHVLVGHGLLP